MFALIGANAHSRWTREIALARTTIAFKIPTRKCELCVSFWLFHAATIFPFQPAISVIHIIAANVECIAVRFCCTSELYYCWQSVALFYASCTACLSLYCSRCVYCFFIISTIFFFSSMDLFCFGRLLSVTITWETDPPFSSFSMIYAIWLVSRVHLSLSLFIEWCEK